MATQNYVLLERIQLTGNVTNITFSNIPQSGYTDLKIVASMRVTNSALYADILIRPNASSSSLSCRILYSNGAAIYSAGIADSYGATANGATSTSSTFSNVEWYFPNYTSSAYKAFSADGVWENNAQTASNVMGADLWSNTAAISSLRIDGDFVAGSTFSLYGLSAVGTTPTAPKASGGNQFYSDGTYWYHLFTSSGTFTPNQPLSCDILQVAGGGGAGGGVGGGGGAGGVLAFASQSVSIATSVTVGAGGIGGWGDGVDGATNGTNSQFGALTASVGGGKGGSINSGQAGANGGSGGGGAGSNTYGTGTSGQGSNGATTSNAGGGGGGKGGAGSSGSSSLIGGDGGASVNTVTNWGSLSTVLNATGLGVSGYIAGGGAGAGNGGSSGGTGGGGGAGNGGSTSTGGNATASTGSGGGGGGYQAGGSLSQRGGSGASGLVIIRYTV